MIQQLTLKNFGIISQATIQFDAGFTAVTGETGAGKSLIIDAIGLLIGRAGSDDWIKTGETEAFVEGVFVLKKIPESLRDLVEEDGVCIVQRRMVRGRASNAKLNQNMVPLKFLKEAMAEVVQLVGQHDMFALFKPDEQRQLLDNLLLANPVSAALFATYTKHYETYRSILGLLDIDDSAQTKWEREADFLRFQLEDLSKYRLDPDEELALLEKKQHFKRHYAISQLADGALDHLDKALGHLMEVVYPLQKISELNPDVLPACETLYGVRVTTGELQDSVTKMLASIERVSDSDFDAIESRLDVLLKLRLKYKVGTIYELCERKKSYETELAELEKKQSDIADAKAQLAIVESTLRDVAAEITGARQSLAARLSGRIEGSLRELQFLQSQFEIKVLPDSDRLTAMGQDTVQFLLSVNPGDAPKPMEKTASGGELSRVFLALKTVLRDSSPVSLMIFDEVDTGIGGLTASSVGTYLAKLAGVTDGRVPDSQVFCVTHLPQIAMQATIHIHVLKYQENDDTKVVLRKLDTTETKQELQRMMGGDTVIQELLR
jgi:DNA repair protein RecN (Recombination protein N)